MPVLVYLPSVLVGDDMNAILALYNVPTYGIRSGFNYYEPVAAPAHFASAAALWAVMKAEGFFTGSFPYKYYTPAQATLIGDAGILAAILAEGITVGDISAGIVYHSPGDTDAVILAALRNDGYSSGAGHLVVVPNPDVPPLTDSVVAEGTALTLSNVYQTIPALAPALTPIRSGFIMVWVQVELDGGNYQNTDIITVTLLVNGAAQAHVIAYHADAVTGGADHFLHGYYRIAVAPPTTYTLTLQAKNSGGSRGHVLIGAQIMAWQVQS